MKIASIALAFASAFLLVYWCHDDIFRLWQRYLDRYATQLKQGLEFLYHAVDERTARRILTGFVLGGFSVAFLATWNIFTASYVGAFAFAIPVVAIRMMQQRRIEAFNEQLMDVITLLSNSLKSGLGLQQAMEMAARDLRPPASQEFGMVLKEMRLGSSVEDALQRLNDRLKLMELDMLVTAIATLRQTGGNMTETFDSIVHVIKERRKIEGKIRALTAQGLMQANILCVMPYVLMVMMWVMDRTYIEPLYTTALGWVLLTLSTVMVVMGYFVIRKIVTIEV